MRGIKFEYLLLPKPSYHTKPFSLFKSMNDTSQTKMGGIDQLYCYWYGWVSSNREWLILKPSIKLTNGSFGCVIGIGCAFFDLFLAFIHEASQITKIMPIA